MKRKLAIKSLTASDLTFFEWHFRNNNAGNQKAINLNSDVFIEKFYPALPDTALESGWRIPVDLLVYGPGIRPCLRLQRKIMKGSTYKNWRLNGEFIYNPEDEPERFNRLEPDDMAVMEFSGLISPGSAKVFLISRNDPDDAAIYTLLRGFLETRSMKEISMFDMEKLLHQASPDMDHPVRYFFLEESLEEFVLTGNPDPSRFAPKTSAFSISQEDLNLAKRNAEVNGMRGEEFVNHFFEQKQEAGILEAFNWVSKENAVSPFDFSFQTREGVFLVDVKSTNGLFNRDFYISLSELKAIANASGKYHIYRIFEIQEDSAKLRIAENMGPFAQSVLDSFSTLPDGVKPNGVSVKPEILDFGEVQIIRLQD